MSIDTKLQPQQFSLFDSEQPSTSTAAADATAPIGRYSNFVVYVDESGDHGMHKLTQIIPSSCWRSAFSTNDTIAKRLFPHCISSSSITSATI